MKHEPEFHKQPERDPRPAKELADCYARVFLGTDDGKRILADLRHNFGVGREVFTPGPHGRPDYLSAAKIDGQRDVMRHVEDALRFGAPPKTNL